MNSKTIPAPSKSETFTTLPAENKSLPPITTVGLKFHEAVDLIEGRAEAVEHFHHAKHAIERHIENTTDLEEKGVGYYYLLRIMLAERIFYENQRAKKLYHEMILNFHAAETSYKKDRKVAKNKPERAIIQKQMEAFYQLMDGYIRALELIYEKKGFTMAKDRAHEDKMRFRRRAAQATGRHVQHLGHLFLEHSSNYGHSFLRWGVTSLLLVILFGLIFAGLSAATAEPVLNLPADTTWFDYFYFSLIAFTTVGFGDITPITPLAKLLAGMAGVLGYIMLGVFITLIQKKL